MTFQRAEEETWSPSAWSGFERQMWSFYRELSALAGLSDSKEQCDRWAPDTNHFCESPWGVWVSGSTVSPEEKRHTPTTLQEPNHLRAWRLKNWKINWRCFWRFHGFQRPWSPKEDMLLKRELGEEDTGSSSQHLLSHLDFVTVFPKTRLHPTSLSHRTNGCIFLVLFPIIGECYLLLPWCPKVVKVSVFIHVKRIRNGKLKCN